MANYEDYDDSDDEPFDYGSLPEQEQRDFLYELIGFRRDEEGVFHPQDQTAHDLFWDYRNQTGPDQLDAERSLVEHFWEDYGIDFFDIWDWEDFRDWYDSQ